jgi:hypothetical protein
MSSTRSILLGIAGVAIVGFIGLQLVPGFDHTNPPAVNTIQWNSPETEQLMRNACYDCHTNETRWPWYSYIAPVKWLVVKDVNEGRESMNLSDGTGETSARDLIRQIQRGEMPPAIYVAMHPEANLTAAQRQQLIDGIQASAANLPRGGGEGGEGGERGEGSDD